MKIKTIRKPDEFIPEFNGNKELPEDEQIKINIKSFPSLPEAQNYQGLKISEQGSFEMVYSSDAIMLTRHVGAIKNLEIEGQAQGEAITNGSSLAKSKFLELSPLVKEIRDFLLEAADLIPQGES